MNVIVIDVLAQDQLQCRSLVISIRSRHSRLALAIQRSAIAFARGARTGVLMIRRQRRLQYGAHLAWTATAFAR
jgi:hypothetical protein